jgi:hypothetical protein
MMSAGASQSLIKIDAVEAAKIPIGMRMKREAMLQPYLNQPSSSS